MAYKKTDKLIQYNNAYNKENYDRISFLIPKGGRDYLKDVAASEGIKVNALIKRAIERELERIGAEPLPDGKSEKQ